MREKLLIILILRGILGGLLGALILYAELMMNQFPTRWPNSNWLSWLLLAYTFFGLPSGLVIGAMTGTTIWLIHHYAGAHLGWVRRIVIGMLIGMGCLQVFDWLLRLVAENSSDYVAGSWHESLFRLFLLGGSIGALSGLIVGRQPSGKKASALEVGLREDWNDQE